MSAVSYYLEAAGLATTGISLIREQTEQMRVPRALWVPFELGRPFGTPGAHDFQRQVLSAALSLLTRDDGPVVLEDFPDDAPAAEVPGDEEPSGWSCPVVFAPENAVQGSLGDEVAREMSLLEPWHALYRETRGKAFFATAPVGRAVVVAALADIATDHPVTDAGVTMPLAQWLRLGCDDLRTWYIDAALGQPGHATSAQLYEWFWTGTAAARLFGVAGVRMLAHPDAQVVALAERALIPRAYRAMLMPGKT